MMSDVMNAPTKLTGFAAILATLVAGGVALGGAIDPDRSTAESAEAHGSEMPGGETADHPVRGVAVAENGLRLVVDDPELARGRSEQLTFRVVDEDGVTVSDFDVAHTKRMHTIVV